MSTTRILSETELAARAASSRAEQNLGPVVTNPATIMQVACLAAGALRQRAVEAVMADAEVT